MPDPKKTGRFPLTSFQLGAIAALSCVLFAGWLGWWP